MNPEPSGTGWLPIRIGRDTQSGKVVVPWLDFGAATLAEPFFDQTVARLRRADPPAKEETSGLETLLEFGETLPPVTPAGFIFHVSGCGSTLVANALKRALGTVVVTEMQPLSILLTPDAAGFAEGSGLSWEELREAAYRALVSLLANYRSHSPERVVIKFPSWTIQHWAVVRSIWPTVPTLVIIREPVEVMVKAMPGKMGKMMGWMELKNSPEQACRVLGWSSSPDSVAKMSREEYAARVVSGYFAAAAAMPRDRTKVVDYGDLDAGEMQEIGKYFGLEIPAEKIEQVLGVNAKDPEGVRPFRSDRESKQARATPLIRVAAFHWADADYRSLKKRASDPNA